MRLRIRKSVPRIPARHVKRFVSIPIGTIADAQNGRGGLDHRIRPLQDEMSFVGQAVTCWCGPGDNLAALAALELAGKGDVLIIATDSCETAGVIGDRYAASCRNRGIAAIVTDGIVRDRAGILASAVPCYARGVTATSVYSEGPGEVNLPVVIGNVPVSPGDLVAGDPDGVVIVARAAVNQTGRRISEVRIREQEFEREIGLGLRSFPGIADLLESGEVEWVS